MGLAHFIVADVREFEIGFDDAGNTIERRGLDDEPSPGTALSTHNPLPLEDAHGFAERFTAHAKALEQYRLHAKPLAHAPAARQDFPGNPARDNTGQLAAE